MRLCGETNETTLEEVAEKIKEEIKHEIGLLSNKVTDVKKLLLSGSGERNETNIECDAAELSKQALVSALVSNCIPLLVQQNVNGSSFFNRSWAEFKVGFNDSIGNYWLGNELLSQLTVNNMYKLKFDLQSRNHTSHWYHAEYSTFRVLPETQNYKLQVTGYSGNAGYDAFGILNGANFSTYDRDNDRLAHLNCAVRKGGGFWYEPTHRCALCGVNGARSLTSFWWWSLPGGYFLQSSRMWLQCKQ